MMERLSESGAIMSTDVPLYCVSQIDMTCKALHAEHVPAMGTAQPEKHISRHHLIEQTHIAISSETEMQ